VLLQGLHGGSGELEALQLISLGFESVDDVADDLPLHAVRFDHDI